MIKSVLPLSLPIFAAIVVVLIVSPPGFAQEKIAGIGLSAAVWLIGYTLLRWAEDKNPQLLLGMLLGGMLFRIAVVLLSIYFVDKFTDFEQIRYVVSLLIFYLACEFALVFDYLLRK